VIVWWKHKNVLWTSAEYNATGMMDHILVWNAKKRYGGYEGQLRLWIERDG
jgi:hypothetical protein